MITARNIRFAILLSSILLVSGFHYLTLPDSQYHHAAYRAMFYFPLVLGSFWFGLRGAVGVCLLVSASYMPYVLIQWQGFSVQDFNRLIEGVVFNGAGLLLGFLVERERQRAKKLIEVEKLASIGKSVAEVAHDLKSPLVTIGGFATQLLRKVDHDHPNHRKLEVIVRESGRMESMVMEMLDFGRHLELRSEEVNLNDIVGSVIERLGPHALEKKVNFKIDLDPSLTEILADAMKIGQVVDNLVVNAIQASPKGEQVVVKTKKMGNKTELKVIDRGCGIQKGQDDVFRPFFTTKANGTGLGLPIVKKFVEAHGGRISWQPNPSGGVTFAVVLNSIPGNPPLKAVQSSMSSYCRPQSQCGA